MTHISWDLSLWTYWIHFWLSVQLTINQISIPTNCDHSFSWDLRKKNELTMNNLIELRQLLTQSNWITYHPKFKCRIVRCRWKRDRNQKKNIEQLQRPEYIDPVIQTESFEDEHNSIPFTCSFVLLLICLHLFRARCIMIFRCYA